MERNKHFKVKQCSLAGGDTIYKVYGAQTRLQRFLGMSDEYCQNFIRFEDALDCIEKLADIRVIKTRTVFKTTPLNTKGKKAHCVKLKK